MWLICVLAGCVESSDKSPRVKISKHRKIITIPIITIGLTLTVWRCLHWPPPLLLSKVFSHQCLQHFDLLLFLRINILVWNRKKSYSVLEGKTYSGLHLSLYNVFFDNSQCRSLVRCLWWCGRHTLCVPAWWRGGGVLGPERPAGSHLLHFGAEIRRWPANPEIKH